ncbi:MAG: SPOR domain-containing protein [Polyangiaceae bacterium]|nr:SPOR domain-containing protein [Polyangiaceae bacterium]
MTTINLRNLDQIQELDEAKGSSRLGALVLASIAGGALVAAGVMTSTSAAPPARSQDDPLAALVAESQSEGDTPEEMGGTKLTFPATLSDSALPTTALAAVKSADGKLIRAEPVKQAKAGPPSAADSLPVVPLPVGTLLAATRVTQQPSDELALLAKDRAEPAGAADTAAPVGAEGGYQIQVASFSNQVEADKFVLELRKRGHRAYRQAAYVPDRGLWHRVRIGPFKNKYKAKRYKRDFEKTERMTSFVVDPDRVKRQKTVRAAKLAARMKKYGRP